MPSRKRKESLSATLDKTKELSVPRALVQYMPRVQCALFPHMTYALCALVPHALRALLPFTCSRASHVSCQMRGCA